MYLLGVRQHLVMMTLVALSARLSCGYILKKENNMDRLYTETSRLTFINDKSKMGQHKDIYSNCKKVNAKPMRFWDVHTARGFQVYIANASTFTKIGYWIEKNNYATKKKYVYGDGTSDDFMVWAAGTTPDYYDNCLYVSHGSPRLNAVGCDTRRYTACVDRYVDMYDKDKSPSFTVAESKDGYSAHITAKLDLKWSRTIRHRFWVEPSKVESSMLMVHDMPVYSDSSLKFDVKVPSYADYDVWAFPCITECCCGPVNSTKKYQHKGAPIPPTQVEMNYFPAMAACELAWIFPDGMPREDVAGFKVIAESVPVHYGGSAEDMTDKEIFEIDAVVEHTVKTKPNRKYSMYIQTKGRKNFLSERVKAQGECETVAAAPPFVSSPALLTVDGERKIRITLPNEDNGRISCLFVLMKPMSGSDLQSSTSDKYTLDELKKADPSRVVVGSDYLGIAISRNTIQGPFVDVVIGDSEKTQCDINQSPASRAFGFDGGDALEFKGENWGLRPEWSYGITVVVTVPTPGSPKFAVSASTIIVKSATGSQPGPAQSAGGGNSGGGKLPPLVPPPKKSEEEESEGCSSIGMTAAAILAVTLVLEIGVFGAAIVKKKASKRPQADKEDEEEEEEDDDDDDEEEEEEEDSD